MSYTTVLIIFCLIIIVIFVCLKIRNRQQWFSRYNKILLENGAKLTELYNELESYLMYDSGYFNYKKSLLWKERTMRVLDIYNNIPNLEKYLIKGDIVTLAKLRKLIEDLEGIRTNYNDGFVKYETVDKREYFDNVLSNPLDNEQRKSIIIDEDNNLIIAGAGCGKTTTIEGKVNYLIDHRGVTASELLLLSFTKKSADEMNTRVNKYREEKINVQTFNALGLSIISNVLGDNRPIVLDEDEMKLLVNNIFFEMRNDSKFLTILNDFFLSYLKIPPEHNSIKGYAELKRYLKDNDIVCLKEIRVHFQGRETIERQFVKSFEEVLIANFFLLNQIKYDYQKNYEINTASKDYGQYRPDFYLPDYGIYVEHFGIDKMGNVPKWFGNINGVYDQQRYILMNQKYKDKIVWAEKVHTENNTKLVKTFSWQNSDGILFEELKKSLEIHGVSFCPLDPKQVWAVIMQNSERDVTNFETLIKTVLTLLKSNDISIQNLTRDIFDKNNSFQEKREKAFFEIFVPIYNKYQSKLALENKIDFNDMVNLATNYVNSNQYKKKIDYIIVDEFQDMSLGRYRLLNAILRQNNSCKLFCVGDDWQSIFRFGGSDIGLFTDFEKHFGFTHKSKITTTYRFNKSTIKLSSAFIQKNPKQIRKKLKDKSTYPNKGIIIFKSTSSKPMFDLFPIKQALDDIINDIQKFEKSYDNTTILVLGRYRFDLEVFKRSQEFECKYDKENNSNKIIWRQLPGIKINFLTIHRSKGLQADYVILLNCNSGKNGIPSEQADDPILNMLLSRADQFENSEERRLFYVAITRAINRTYVISSTTSPSKFVTEIENYSKNILSR